MAWVPGKGPTSDQVARGTFSAWPAATPKYATNDGAVRDFQDTMARMYLWLDGPTFTRFQDVAKGFDPRTQNIAQRIAASTVPTSGGFGYVEFLLQSAAHQLQEKVSVVDTLADHFATYSFGQEPARFTYELALINSKQNDQANNMFRLYRSILRATALASLKTEVHLQYNGMIVSGAVLSFSWNLSAADESYCPAALSLLVRKVTLLDETPDQYDGTVTLGRAAGLSDKVLASLIPRLTRGVAGAAVQLVPEPEVTAAPAAAAPAPAATPAAATTPVSPEAQAAARIAFVRLRQAANQNTGAVMPPGPNGTTATSTDLYAASTEALRYVSANRPGTSVGITDVTMAHRTYEDLQARNETYDASGNLVIPSTLSAGQRDAYIAIAERTRNNFADTLNKKTGTQL